MSYTRDDSIDELIGRRIARSRVRAGYTQVELSQIIGMDQSAIARLELGLRKLHYAEGRRIEIVLDLEPGDLIPGAMTDTWTSHYKRFDAPNALRLHHGRDDDERPRRVGPREPRD